MTNNGTTMNQFSTLPPQSASLKFSVPAPYVLLVTISRERAMNSVPMQGHHDGDALWQWYDCEPLLRCAVITGAGTKSFCAGADLLEQRDRQAGADYIPVSMPSTGFLGLSRRNGKKPVIAAVNGYALGGGCEVVLNW